MKNYIKTTVAVSVLTLVLFALGACSSMPESHRSDMQTHEMGPRGKSHSMGNSTMPERTGY